MVNWDRVRTLREEVGAEDFDEIIELFFTEVGNVVEALPFVESAKAMADQLHFLKSGALNLGFDGLSDLCSHGEATANEGTMDGIDVEAVQQSYYDAKAHFHAHQNNKLSS
ncbi:MAG: Hpt domain-containing protein [Sulfitobacter sp.]